MIKSDAEPRLNVMSSSTPPSAIAHLDMKEIHWLHAPGLFAPLIQIVAPTKSVTIDQEAILERRTALIFATGMLAILKPDVKLRTIRRTASAILHYRVMANLSVLHVRQIAN